MRNGELFAIFNEYLEENETEQEMRLRPDAPEKAKKAFEEWLKEENEARADGITL
jgi:hypothetical protein